MKRSLKALKHLSNVKGSSQLTFRKNSVKSDACNREEQHDFNSRDLSSFWSF